MDTPTMIHEDTVRMPSDVVGQGPRLVLVGGGLTGWASWEPHAAHLARQRTVARLQLLAVHYGLEGRPLPHDYSVTLERHAMHSTLDALGWTEPVDIVAWSYGALVTLDFALAAPDRIRSLTLIEPPAYWLLSDQDRNDPEVRRLEIYTRSISDPVTEDELLEFIHMAALAPPDSRPQDLPQWPVWLRHRQSLRSGIAPLEHRGDRQRLRAFDRPVLLVTGTGTSTWLRAIHETLARELPRARTLELPAGHAPQIVSMDAFLEAVAAFQRP